MTEKAHFGIVEIGTFLGFASLFAFIVSRALASASLVPRNHPYLEECMEHHIA